MNYKLLQKIKRLIFYPFRLIGLPIIFILGFFITNFEDEDDREYYIKIIKIFLFPL
jgi:hypothetical protein